MAKDKDRGRSASPQGRISAKMVLNTSNLSVRWATRSHTVGSELRRQATRLHSRRTASLYLIKLRAVYWLCATDPPDEARTMSDEAAMLAAIRDEPGDDLPRFAHADWLEEHGEFARARFVRVQIERTGCPKMTTGRRTSLPRSAACSSSTAPTGCRPKCR